MMVHLISLFVSVLSIAWVSAEYVIVETKNGSILGLTTKTRRGRDVFAFYGVRYAEPPIGKYRFKPPQPLKKRWRGIYKATLTGQACMQKDVIEPYTVSEDCLYLDIYSVNLNADYPVIVFFPGGGYINYYKMIASPEYLLDKNVVLVSINYRINAFGFFSIGTKDASGNQGFKDQNMALRWIRDNIESFGGNPNLITISGQSAGAYSATMHMLSPMSRGLFHRVIAVSGAAVGITESSTRKSSQLLLERTNCSKSDSSASVACLQKVPGTAILEVNDMFEYMLPWNYDVETDTDDEPFLTEQPVDLARQGLMHKVPLMIGVTLDELYFLAYEIVHYNPRLTYDLNHFREDTLPNYLLFPTHPNKSEISRQLYAFYMKDQTLSTYNIRAFGRLLSDAVIQHGVHRMVEYARQVTNVYYYQMNYQGRYSTYYNSEGKPFGVLHSDDLQYSLVFKEMAPVMDESAPENPTIERIVGWWTKFAETGDPNDASNNWTNDVHWAPCNKEGVQDMYVNETYWISSEANKDRYGLWDSLFPLY